MTAKLRFPSLLLWLTALWVGLWGEVTLGNVAAGLILAVGVVLVARPVGVAGRNSTHFRPLAALHYALYFLWELTKSNLIVAWEIVTPARGINRAVIAMPMHTTSAGVVTIVANSITLTPGTVTIDVRESERDDGSGLIDRTLLIHVLHYVDLDTVRRDVRRLERLAIRAFGPRDDLARVESELAELEAS